MLVGRAARHRQNCDTELTARFLDVADVVGDVQLTAGDRQCKCGQQVTDGRHRRFLHEFEHYSVSNALSLKLEIRCWLDGVDWCRIHGRLARAVSCVLRRLAAE